MNIISLLQACDIPNAWSVEVCEPYSDSWVHHMGPLLIYEEALRILKEVEIHPMTKAGSKHRIRPWFLYDLQGRSTRYLVQP
jgi:hypothetical protein